MDSIICPFDNITFNKLLEKLGTIQKISPQKLYILSKGINIDNMEGNDTIRRRFYIWNECEKLFAIKSRISFPLLYEMVVYVVFVYRLYIINLVIPGDTTYMQMDAINRIISAKYDCNTELLYESFHVKPLNTIKKLMKKHNKELNRLSNMKSQEDISNSVSGFKKYDETMGSYYYKFDIDIRLKQTVYDKKLLINVMKYVAHNYTSICIALKPLNLPVYVVSWILDRMEFTIDSMCLYESYDIPHWMVRTFQGFDLNRNNKSHEIPLFALLTDLKKLRTIESVQTFHDRKLC